MSRFTRRGAPAVIRYPHAGKSHLDDAAERGRAGIDLHNFRGHCTGARIGGIQSVSEPGRSEFAWQWEDRPTAFSGWGWRKPFGRSDLVWRWDYRPPSVLHTYYAV